MKARLDCDCPWHNSGWIHVVAGVLVRPAWVGLLVLAACAPLFAAAANWTYLGALPSRFQTERATTPDLGDWKTVCTVPDMEVAVVRSPPDTSLARAGQAWLRAKDEYVVLTMPSCHTRLITKPDATMQLDLDFVSPAGVYLMRNWDNKTRQTHWWVGNGSLRPSSRVPEGSTIFGMPVLSNDGHWVAWMELIPGTKLRRAVVQSLNDERVHLVDIPDQRLLQWTLLALDMDRKELTFYAYDYTTRRSSLTMLGLGSEREGDSLVVYGVDAQFTNLLRVGSGWVAWDATREPGKRYRVAWSLANGRGAHKALWGRSITAVKWIRMAHTLPSARPPRSAIITSRMPSTSFARVMARKSGTGIYRRMPAVRSPFSARSFSPIPTWTERALQCASCKYQIKSSRLQSARHVPPEDRLVCLRFVHIFFVDS